VISAGLIVAVRDVVVPVIPTGVPFQLIVQVPSKFVPVATSVIGAAVADVVGDMPVSVTSGMLRDSADVVESPHVTVTEMDVPAPAVRSAGVIAAVN
jgi:hypothetical protein